MIKQCSVCGGTHDVWDDGICGGCYMVRVAKALGISYGQAVALYGYNWRRSAAVASGGAVPVRRCLQCEANIEHLRKNAKYCSRHCFNAARWQRRPVAAKVAKKKTCRGCQWRVDGSKRCANPKSEFYGTAMDRCCTKIAYRVVEDG